MVEQWFGKVSEEEPAKTLDPHLERVSDMTTHLKGTDYSLKINRKKPQTELLPMAVSEGRKNHAFVRNGNLFQLSKTKHSNVQHRCVLFVQTYCGWTESCNPTNIGTNDQQVAGADLSNNS